MTDQPRTQYYTAATLDGFIADDSHSLDWLHQVPDAGNEDYPDFISRVGALAMGAATYEWDARTPHPPRRGPSHTLAL
jgi:dihydrofolate reductase